MDSIQFHHHMNVDYWQEFDWLYQEDPFLSGLDLNPPLTQSLECLSNSNFFEFDSLANGSMELIPLPDQCNNYFPDLDFKEFDDYDFNYNTLFWDNEIPSSHRVGVNDFCVNSNVIKREVDSSNEIHQERKKCSTGKVMKSSSLEFEEIQKHFNVPITIAAKEMKVGLTVLKKRCRELNITRWPHRKIKSLSSLIKNVKELGLTREVQMLEEHKRQVEKLPEIELTENTKKLRQACFKANYKKRRSLLALDS